MSLLLWSLVAAMVIASAVTALYFWVHRHRKPQMLGTSVLTPAPPPEPDPLPVHAADQTPYKISYVPSDKEWSGSTNGALPLKTLTYKQYECLEDARYGFKIVGVKPTERKNEQHHKTRAHGQKTVASLVRHGFLISNGDEAFIVTDHGLNALEVCDVRY